MSYSKEVTSESFLKPHYKKYKNRDYTFEELRNLNTFGNVKKLLNNGKVLHPENFKEECKAYEIGVESGFYYIPNPFSSQALLKLIIDALSKWPNVSNKMNLDIDENRPNDIWKASLIQWNDDGTKLNDSWLYKLRWTSLGYHYQWTKRVYKADCRSDIPDNLTEVMKDIIALMDWPEFIPEAAIVNYYHLNSAMCFHQDHAEIAQDVPLVSMSLGQPAVYLLGTSDPKDTPVPITLYHGDVVVMSGPSRLAYHAVPKIIGMSQSNLTNQIFDCDLNESDVIEKLMSLIEDDTCCYGDGMVTKERAARMIWEYLQKSRININMRQVLHKGQEFPTEEV